MSNENQETIADIVADIRAQNQGLPEDSYALSPLVCDLLSFADRIEAANKREIASKDEKIASLRTIIDEFGAVVRITDKEFLKGETECPLYGKAIEEKKNHHWCAYCNIGTDGTAVCLFRKCEREVKDGE